MKKKILVIALAMAVMLMGAGYAYWTDATVLNATVTTGEFDVNITNVATAGGGDRGGAAGGVTTNWEEFLEVDTDFTGPTKNLTVWFEDLYPGSIAHLNFYIENQGTLPAVLDNIDIEPLNISLGEDLAAALGYRFNYQVLAPGESISWGAGGIDYVSGNGITNLENDLNELLGDVILMPGERIEFFVQDGDSLYNGMWFELPSSLTGDECEDESIDFTMTMNWVQHNATFPAITF